PARIVVVLRDLVETELLVVIRPDPFGRVYGSFLQRRVNVTACDLLRHHAELLQGLAGPAADAKFQPFEIIDGLDLLAEPAAHLRAGIPGDEAVGVELFAELV